jgi:MraZ protein
LFRGISSLNLDTKGRLAIPKRYREQLVDVCASELVITADMDHCLLIYPKPTWLEIEKKLVAMPTFDPAARNMQRLYIGSAAELEMDGQGRILLPPELRKFAALDKKVALVGQMNKFELWDEDTWKSKQEDWLQNVDLTDLNLPPEFKSLSI